MKILTRTLRMRGFNVKYYLDGELHEEVLNVPSGVDINELLPENAVLCDREEIFSKDVKVSLPISDLLRYGEILSEINVAK